MHDNKSFNIAHRFAQCALRNQSVKRSNQNKEQGMVALTTVCILLAIVGLTLISTAQNIDNFNQMEKATRTSELKKVALQEALIAIANKLREDPTVISPLNTLGIEHTITALNLRGENNQKLHQFTIRVSQANEDIFYSAQFLRYPSLLQLPRLTQHNSHDNSITEWLFNRTSNTLRPQFFPEHRQLNSCADLSATKVQWVVGDCTIDNDINAFNSSSAPQLLIVENGNVSLTSGTKFYGLLLLLTRSKNTYNIHIDKNAQLIGALLANESLIRFINGSSSYSKSTLTTLQDNHALSKMVLIPGTWHDF